MSTSIPLRAPTAASVVTESELVREIRGKTAQLTILRRANPLFDYFNLQETRFLGELSITWWRELGCWATIKGSTSQAIYGTSLTFIPEKVANLKKTLAKLRKERPLDTFCP